MADEARRNEVLDLMKACQSVPVVLGDRHSKAVEACRQALAEAKAREVRKLLRATTRNGP